MHQKQPVPKVAVSKLSDPVNLPAGELELLFSDGANDIDLFGFSRCAQEGEKNVKNEPVANSDNKEKLSQRR